MQLTRKELLTAEATMNQMRNAVAHLARFMINNYVDDVDNRLQRMGRNIARTYSNYWKPTNFVDLNNVKDVIATIYRNVLNSSVSVEILSEDNIIQIHDKKCAMCKYKYEDIDFAGCEILVGMVAEMINIINSDTKDKTAIFLTPLKVSESRGYGDEHCTQLLTYQVGGKQ